MTALGFLTMCSNMGMQGAGEALREYKRQRAALVEIKLDAFSQPRAKGLATAALKRVKTGRVKRKDWLG